MGRNPESPLGWQKKVPRVGLFVMDAVSTQMAVQCVISFLSSLWANSMASLLNTDGPLSNSKRRGTYAHVDFWRSKAGRGFPETILVSSTPMRTPRVRIGSLH